MRPAFTSSRNCEYSIGASAAWRVLNWLNTVISTSPMTSQMTRFLSMLFNDLLILRRCQAPRHHVGLARFTARRLGFHDFHMREAFLEPRAELAERFAMKCLDQENPLGLEHVAAKVDGRERELGQPRLVDVRDARQIRRYVAKNDIGFLLQYLLAEVTPQNGHSGDGDDRQQINGDDAPAGFHPCCGDLRPAAGRRAQVDDRGAWAEEFLPLV